MSADPQRAYERAEDDIEDAYNEGRMTMAERNAELRELARDYQAEAEEAARCAYDEELGRW